MSAETPKFDLAPFFNSILGDSAPGFIEVRLFLDGQKGPIVARRFYPTVEAFLADLPSLLELAATTRSGIYFGVRRRKSTTSGKSVDTLSGRAVWVDIDYKAFAGKEEEARGRLEKCSIQPSAIVRSGNGLHCYWLVDADLDQAATEELNKAIADALGGDHAWDAARVLRVPGTFNRKDGENPKLVEIETFDPLRVYPVADLRRVLRLTDTPKAKPSARTEPGDLTFDEQDLTRGLTPMVQVLIDKDRKIRDLFFGRGKPTRGPDGRQLDVTGSGYDYSFALALLQNGVTDPAEVCAALVCRPDGHARGKGVAYIRRTVQSAIEFWEQSQSPKRPEECLDFEVERFVIFSSDPPSYKMTIQGIDLPMEADDLLSTARFRKRFVEALHRIPTIPEEDAWDELVNTWLASAEQVALPPEASAEGALREAVVSAVEQMPVCDDVTDLDRGKAIKVEDGRLAFKLNTILEIVGETVPKVGRNNVARVLRELGYESSIHRIGPVTFRAWAAKPAT